MRREGGARIRVCHVVTKLDVGGAAATVVRICAGLDPSRYDVRIIAGCDIGRGGELISEASSKGIAVELIPSLVGPISLTRDVSAYLKLLRTLRAGRFDVVHTHSSKAGVLGRLAAKCARVPVIVHTVHGWSFHDGLSPLVRKAYIGLERLLARMTTQLIVVTPLDRDKGVAAGVAFPNAFSLIRSGIDLSDFSSPVDQRAAGRAALGISPSTPVVGTVARLSRQKDPLTLVDAIALAAVDVPGLRLALVGDGPLRTRVEHRAEELGISDAVMFLGVRRDVAKLIPAFDVFALPSLWEGLPRTILEAMACGVPVVTTGVDGIGEVVRHGQTGFLVAPGDAAGLARRLRRLFEHPEEGAYVAAQARRSLGAFGAGTMVNEVQVLYESLLGKAGRSRPEVHVGGVNVGGSRAGV